MKTDGIIFDLDGTLWDSCESVAKSWQATLRRYDPQRSITVEQVRSIMGMTAPQLAQRLFPDLGDRAMEVCLQALREECPYVAEHGGFIYPGVALLFERFSKQCGIYIVSNCLDGYIESFLAYSGLGGYVRDYLNPAVTGLDKAGNIRAIIDRHAMRRPVYVGDTELDRQSAEEASCPFIHAAYGFGRLRMPSMAINAFTELENMLEFDNEGDESHV